MAQFWTTSTCFSITSTASSIGQIFSVQSYSFKAVMSVLVPPTYLWLFVFEDIFLNSHQICLWIGLEISPLLQSQVIHIISSISLRERYGNTWEYLIWLIMGWESMTRVENSPSKTCWQEQKKQPLITMIWWPDSSLLIILLIQYLL